MISQYGGLLEILPWQDGLTFHQRCYPSSRLKKWIESCQGSVETEVVITTEDHVTREGRTYLKQTLQGIRIKFHDHRDAVRFKLVWTTEELVL